MKIPTLRRAISIGTILLILGSILIIVGTAYTADRLAVQSVTTRRLADSQGFTMEMIFQIRNAGIFEVDLFLDGRILSGQNTVVQNSAYWPVPPSGGGNYTFSLHVDNATAMTYFNSTSSQPIFDFSLNARTAYGLISVSMAGSENINPSGG